MAVETERVVYDDRIARQFVLASIFWGIAGMALGLWVALQLAFWPANVAPHLSFGRLRPLHTHAAVFAFAGNMIFAGIYYSSQRLLEVRLPSRLLGAAHFWGWQLVTAAAAVTLPLGYTQGKEHAELEWPIDVAIALLWLLFAVHFFWMMKRRRRARLYVSIWFYVATILAVTTLHLLDSLAVPVGPLKSYPLLGGIEAAVLQSLYRESAVAFFMVAPVLGIFYYLLPKAAERPIHSYRLAIIHFWSLTFLYGWIGPHDLLNTALPDWLQTLAVATSVMLWGASWAGVANGLATLRGTWSRARSEPVLKFLAAAILFYGLAALEAPILSFQSVASLASYTDWTIGHAHVGALGWNGFMAAALFYWLVPRLYEIRLHSPAAAHTHFYLATVGLLLYVSSMWIAGVTQGLMWRARTPDGGLAYTFVDTIAALDLSYWGRIAGGALYLAGFLVMAWNLYKTMRAGQATDGESDGELSGRAPAPGLGGLLFGQPVVMTAAVLALLVVAATVNKVAALAFLFLAFTVAGGGLAAALLSRRDGPRWHRRLEDRGLALGLVAFLALFTGGALELLPLVSAEPKEQESAHEPYTALQLEGRDVYLEEGCRACHSQMIRPFLWEVARYGEVSAAYESAYDRPLQWGSKRIGPDLARVGGTYPNLWHYQHMIDPRSVTVGSNMPPYRHLARARVDYSRTAAKMRAMQAAGVPYAAEAIASAREDALAEARAIAGDLRETGEVEVAAESKLVALIAYLQRLGHASAEPPEEVAP